MSQSTPIIAVSVVFDPFQVESHLPTEREVEAVGFDAEGNRITTTVSRPVGPADVIALARQVVYATDARTAHDEALRNIRVFAGKPGLTLVGRTIIRGEADLNRPVAPLTDKQKAKVAQAKAERHGKGGKGKVKATRQNTAKAA